MCYQCCIATVDDFQKMAPEVYAQARAFLGMARGELLKLADDNLKQAEEKTRSPCPNQRFQSLTEKVEDHAHAPYRALSWRSISHCRHRTGLCFRIFGLGQSAGEVRERVPRALTMIGRSSNKSTCQGRMFWRMSDIGGKADITLICRHVHHKAALRNVCFVWHVFAFWQGFESN